MGHSPGAWSGDEHCAVCRRRIVHPDDHLHVPVPAAIDLHRLCVPDWVGYGPAVEALRALTPATAQTRRLLRNLQDCREIPPVL
jgi:hypothetical protein